MKLALRSALVLWIAVILGGCMVARQPAPVVQRSPAPVPVEARPDFYTVQRGDTLYSIARNHGVDYRELASWNQITNPAAIEVGQVLRVKEPAPVASVPEVVVAPPGEPAPGEAVVTPYNAPPPVQGQPMGGEALALPAPSTESAQPPIAGQDSAALVTTPQAVKLPYSKAALAKLQEAPAEASAPAAPAPEIEQRPAPPANPDNASGLAWGWPTKGKIIAGFNENGGPKGVHIAGNLGQAIVASAPGRVVYTGSGLRGYGNLVIIKHNDTYLSAYAHNRAVLVKQGDVVTKGQKIAEMGNSDASRVMLHFEIRRMGKPVDPIKFLPPT